MNVILLASRFPYPPFQGDRLRAYHLLKNLGARHDFTLVTPPPDGDTTECMEAIRPYCRHIEIVTSSRWSSLSRLASAPFSPLPFQTLYAFDPAVTRTVKRLLGERQFDLVHVQLVRMAPIAEHLGGIPTVLDLIDALSLNMARRGQRERGVKRYVALAESNRLLRYERTLVRRFDQLVVCSELDRLNIADAPNLRVVPNGVDIEEHPFSAGERDPATILFSGRMRYYPNVDAVHWFAREILPLVRRDIPEARLQVVGAEPAASIERLGRQEGIEVTGRVPRIQDCLARAAVAVAPLRAGSGMQLKVVEAMAAGTPVVATSFALGGIEAVDGEHLLTAEDAAAFAKQVVRVLRSPTLSRTLASSARRLVEKNYTWSRSMGTMDAIYRTAVGDASVPIGAGRNGD